MPANISYWDRTAFTSSFDVLVIGAGIVGCSAALTCREAGRDLRIGILERGALPDGASTRNAGFACFGSLTEVCADIAAMGEEQTLSLIHRRRSGLLSLLQRLPAEAIDYDAAGGCEIFLPQDEEIYTECMTHLNRLNEQLAPVFGSEVFVPDDAYAVTMGLDGVAHVVRHPFEGVLHPGKMMRMFWQQVEDAGIAMFNGVNVRRLDQEDDYVTVCDAQGMSWRARYVIVATNAYVAGLIDGLPVIPCRNQVYMTGPVKDLALKGCFHYHKGFVYFRPADGRLLIGGARHIDLVTENTAEYGLTEVIRNELERFTREHILHGTPFRFEHAWSGIIGMGEEKTPIVDMIGERVAVAVRLGGMGVAIGCHTGSQAAQCILARC